MQPSRRAEVAGDFTTVNGILDPPIQIPLGILKRMSGFAERLGQIAVGMATCRWSRLQSVLGEANARRRWTWVSARMVRSCNALAVRPQLRTPSRRWRCFANRRHAQNFAEIALRRMAWHLQWYPPCGLRPAAEISRSPSTAGRGLRVEQPTALTSLLRRCACNP